jgi:hypothetical protein
MPKTDKTSNTSKPYKKLCKTEGCEAVRNHVNEWGGRATCGDCKAKAVREAVARKKAVKHTFESWKAMRKQDYPRVDGWGKRAPTADMFVTAGEHAQTVAFWRRETLLTCEQWLQSLAEQGWGSDPRKRKDFFSKEEQNKAFQIWHQNYQKGLSFVRSLQNQARRWASGELQAARAQTGIGADTRRCTADGCNVTASFGSEAGAREFCVQHCDEHMQHLAGVRCSSAECGKQATFGHVGGKAEYCGEHARNLVGYVDVHSKRCETEGCDVIASFGPGGTKTRTHCALHGKELGMELTNNALCSFEGCRGAASFAFPGDTRDRCDTHKLEGMRNTKRFWCIEQGCDSPAYYADSGVFPEWCDRHKVRHDGILFNPTKTCESPGCRQFATHGSFHKSVHCPEHSVDSDISLVEHACSECHLVDVLADGLCEHCGNWVLRTRGYEQRNIKHMLDAHGIEYLHERAVGGVVPDFILKFPTHSVVMEVDENQHKNSRYSTYNQGTYPDEVGRMRAIVSADPSIDAFIRYNPDEYTGGRNLKLSERHETLRGVIHLLRDSGKLNTPCVFKLFYDGYIHPPRPEQL